MDDENIARVKAALEDVESPGGFEEWRRATDEEWDAALIEQAVDERRQRIKRLERMNWGSLSDEAISRVLEIAAAG